MNKKIMTRHTARTLGVVSLLAIALVLAGCKIKTSNQTGTNLNVNESNSINTNSPVSTMKVLTVTLAQQNASGEEGTATITDQSDGVTVKVDLTGAGGITGQPAHIHIGSCATLGGVKYPLTPVTDGKSDTKIAGVTVQDLLSELPLSVNVHKSAAEAGTYVACGEIMDKDVMDKKADDSKKDDGGVAINVNVNATVKAEVKTVTVSAQNFSFNPNEIRVKQGDIVKVVLDNKEGFHDFIIDDFSAATSRINGGESTSVQFTASKKGTFEFYCSVGSHRQMGMRGNLIVE